MKDLRNCIAYKIMDTSAITSIVDRGQPYKNFLKSCYTYKPLMYKEKRIDNIDSYYYVFKDESRIVLSIVHQRPQYMEYIVQDNAYNRPNWYGPNFDNLYLENKEKFDVVVKYDVLENVK